MDTILYSRVYQALVITRLFSPLAIFWWPVGAVVGNFVLDLIDGGAACRGVMKAEDYQKIDKILDWWWFVFVLIYAYLHINNYFLLLFGLFLYRTVGEMLFLLNGNRKWLVIFPNFFEFAFFVIFFTGGINLVSGTFTFGFCVTREYLLHIRNFSARKLLGWEVKWL